MRDRRGHQVVVVVTTRPFVWQSPQELHLALSAQVAFDDDALCCASMTRILSQSRDEPTQVRLREAFASFHALTRAATLGSSLDEIFGAALDCLA